MRLVTCTDVLATWFNEVVIPTYVEQSAEAGKTVFVELIDFDAVAKLEDRLKLQIEEKLRE